jgi:hypothetical protein
LKIEPALGYWVVMPIVERVSGEHMFRRRIEHALLLRVVRTVAVRRNAAVGVCKGFVVLAFDRPRIA